jgi:hypothetical protein
VNTAAGATALAPRCERVGPCARSPDVADLGTRRHEVAVEVPRPLGGEPIVVERERGLVEQGEALGHPTHAQDDTAFAHRAEREEVRIVVATPERLDLTCRDGDRVGIGPAERRFERDVREIPVLDPLIASIEEPLRAADPSRSRHVVPAQGQRVGDLERLHRGTGMIFSLQRTPVRLLGRVDGGVEVAGPPRGVRGRGEVRQGQLDRRADRRVRVARTLPCA